MKGYHLVKNKKIVSTNLRAIEIKVQTTCKAFFKYKKRYGTSLQVSFSEWFLKKILLTDQISFSGWLYFVRYWVIYVLQFFVNQVVASWILKLTLYFLIKPAFFTWRKSQDKKDIYLENKMSFYDEIKSIFPHF